MLLATDSIRISRYGTWTVSKELTFRLVLCDVGLEVAPRVLEERAPGSAALGGS